MNTKTEPLSVSEVRALLVRAVEEKGADYVYVNPNGISAADDPGLSCFNYDPATYKPSCIVGHVLAYAGVDFATANIGQHDPVAHSCVGLMDQPARIALTFAQAEQDSGGTWGAALAAFDEAVAGASA